MIMTNEKLTEELLTEIDQNNMKAWQVLETAAKLLMYDEDVDVSVLVDVAIDYTNRNNDIFKSIM